MITRLLFIASLCLEAVSTAHAITIDELRGYSIQVTGAATGEFRSDDPRVPRFGKMDVDRRVYISQAGHFFSYAHNTAGRVAERGQAVSQLDQATSGHRQRMGVWTIEGGNLTRITHDIEGFIVSTIVIDPSKTTCSITTTMQVDPVTHRYMKQGLHGWVAEMVSLHVDSSVCTITKGNIFASDQ